MELADLVVLGLLWLVTQVLIEPLFTGPIILALLVSSVLGPVVDRLHARGMDRTVATLGGDGGSIATVVAVLAITIAALADSASEVVDTAAIGAGNLGIGVTPVDLVRRLRLGIVSTVASVVSSVAGIAIGLTLAVLLMFFFMRDGRLWWRQILDRVHPTRRTGSGRRRQAVDILRGTTAGTRLVVCRRGPAVLHDVDPGPAARVPDQRPDVLRRVHPLHRLGDRDPARVPRRRRRRRHGSTSS